MKNASRTVAALAVIAASLMASVGCSDTVDDISNRLDCHGVCKRYADCFDADYDVEGCSDRCQNSADAEEDRQRKLRVCDACIDGRSCSDTAFSCTDDCLGIVP